MNSRAYLTQTEYAVQHYYAGLRSLHGIYERGEAQYDVFQEGTPDTDADRQRLDQYLKLATEYFSLKLSEGTIAGAIFQVAATGIRMFSINTTIPEDCREIVPSKAERAIPYCIGRRVYGLPIGLIIYAARNQYAHWEDEPFQVTKNIFNQLTLAFSDNMFYDLAFDLGNPTINIYANEILLGALHWDIYEKYLQEMQELLSTE